MSLEQTILHDRLNGPETPAQSAKATVFIVDDEAMVGEVVSIVLGLEGFKTRLFTSPTDAFEAFESASEKPGLLITDYVMTPFNGIDLIERCRVLVPDLRAILYSGNVDEEQAALFRDVPDALLSKPFLPKHLIHTVQTVLAQTS